MTRESVDLDALEIPELVNRTAPPQGRPFLPFEVRENHRVPDFLPIGGEVPVRQTSSTHGVNGYITIDHKEIAAVVERLKTKINSAVEDISFYESYKADNAETLIVSYGVSSRAVRAVFNELKTTGKPVSLLILKTLWPVPEAVIQRTARDAKRVLVVEMNLGQYVREIKRILPDKTVELLTQMDGRLITPRAIKEKIVNG